MILLPSDWTTCSAEALVRRVIAEIATTELRAAAARQLIWTYFDLLLETRWCDGRVVVRESPRLVWRVGDSQIRYAKAVDDKLLELVGKRAFPASSILVVPPGCGLIVRRAFEGTAGVLPLVRPLDELLGFRHLMTSLDTGWGGVQTLRRLFEVYNRRVERAGEPSEIHVFAR